jgi:hypothetical protein
MDLSSTGGRIPIFTYLAYSDMSQEDKCFPSDSELLNRIFKKYHAVEGAGECFIITSHAFNSNFTISQ